MNNDNPMIIIGVIIFIVILLMLIGALLLLKGGKGRGPKKKVKLRKVKRTVKGSTASKAVSAGSSPAKSTAKASSGKTAPGKAASGKAAPGRAPASPAGKSGSPGKPVPLKGPDEGIEKYARMTGDYIRTKYGIELKRIGLKKYYSERHGFECVDYTYMPSSGTFPAQFRTALNDMDTALTNVSGVDTISFAADAATGTYRTTFYLGK